MRIAHDALVVVADGRKMLFFRNEGDAAAPNLEVIRKEEQRNPPDREQGSDAAGRAFTSAGSPRGGYGNTMGANNRSAYEETDFHQLEEDRFASETADLLRKRALDNDFEQLLIVAPPKTLGELRKHYHKEVRQRLVGEIAKDLTGHPVPEIERIIADA